LSSPAELRSYAVDCARLAQGAAHPHDKARLLNMARAWTDLADRIERLGQLTGSARAADDQVETAKTESGEP
jgi:hypothetical protein